MRRALAGTFAVAGLAAALAGPGVVGAAAAARPTAIVSLGDSYISGEAGRWQGNSNDPAASRDGTDRACSPSIALCTSYDKAKVYVDGSAANGCHRSDVAEILSARIAVDRRVNLACSGAVTANVFRASNGGQAQDGLPPQADQLATVARQDRVKGVVLSIGGNDLGFSSIVQACLTAYVTLQAPCQAAEQPKLTAAFPAMRAGVSKAIDEIRAVLAAAGTKPGEYRFVLQSYPSVMPRAAENRYPETGPLRTSVGGCPFYDSDSNWARDSVVSQIADALEQVAAAKGVQFLDLRDAFQGREVCSVHTQQATPLSAPSATTSEWGRFTQVGSVVLQGDLQETFHPNAYGQQALGTCLTLLAAKGTGTFTCHDTPGAGTGAMTLLPEP
jgi:lysophospholipase L1-like esterase